MKKKERKPLLDYWYVRIGLFLLLFNTVLGMQVYNLFLNLYPDQLFPIVVLIFPFCASVYLLSEIIANS